MKIAALTKFEMDDATETWRLSRDITANTSFQDVSAVDAPVNEMPSALLHFQDFTIIEREIFTTLRNHNMWARTSRVDDPLEFTVPEEFEWNMPHYDEVKEAMRLEKDAGIHQDQWRGRLPLVAHTSWVARHNMRDLIKLHTYFARLATVLPTLMAERCFLICSELIKHIPPQGSYSTYKHENFLCEDYYPKSDGLIFQNEWFTGLRIKAPLMLRAQLVRHRLVSFVDDLWGILYMPDIAYADNKTNVNMECIAPNDLWRSIVAKRSCWIAQFDLWAPLIHILDARGDLLPCNNDKPCPYVADNVLRAQGKDPSPPCPIYCNRTDTRKDMNAMRSYASERPEFWQKEITQ